MRFDGVADRSGAEALRGVRLPVRHADEQLGDPDEFFDHQLLGLLAVTTGGDDVGAVTDVLHLPEQDVLVIARHGTEVLVPFVAQIVPEVDLPRRRVVIDPPPACSGRRRRGLTVRVDVVSDLPRLPVSAHSSLLARRRSCSSTYGTIARLDDWIVIEWTTHLRRRRRHGHVVLMFGHPRWKRWCRPPPFHRLGW